MNASVGVAGIAQIPTVKEPWPDLAGKRGLQLLRQQIGEAVRGRPVKMPDPEAQMARAMIGIIEDSMVPAKPADTARLVEAVMWHYPPVRRPENALASVAQDWLRDLGHLPRDLVDGACTNWRRGTNAFAPAPGHLLEYANPIWQQRLHLLQMARRYIVPVLGSVKAAAGKS